MKPLTERVFTALFSASVALVFSAASVFAHDHKDMDTKDLYPATPQEFAKAYADVSAAMDVEKIVGLASAQVTSMAFTGAPQRTTGNVEQAEALGEFYDGFKAAGRSLTASDYAITQLSDHFAIVRYTWDVAEEDGAMVMRVNSSYVIRLEEDGWRFIAILELGRPQGPGSAQN